MAMAQITHASWAHHHLHVQPQTKVLYIYVLPMEVGLL